MLLGLDLQLLIPAAACFGAGGVLWTAGRSAHAEADALERAPRMTIRDIIEELDRMEREAPGGAAEAAKPRPAAPSVYAVVTGESACPNRLRSRYSNTECCYYHYVFTIMRRFSVDMRDAAPTSLVERGPGARAGGDARSLAARISASPHQHAWPASQVPMGVVDNLLSMFLGISREEFVLREGQEMFVAGHFRRSAAGGDLHVAPPAKDRRATEPLVMGLYSPEEYQQQRRTHGSLLKAFGTVVGLIGLIPLGFMIQGARGRGSEPRGGRTVGGRPSGGAAAARGGGEGPH